MDNLLILEKREFPVQFKFVLSCLGRTKDLYKLFEEEILEDKNNYSIKYQGGYEKINKFYEKYLNIAFGKEIIGADYNELYHLAPSYEEYSTVNSTIATQVALLCTSIGEFYENRSTSLIQEVLINVEEILNIIKSDEYNEMGIEEDSWEFIKFHIAKEEEVQLKLLSQIASANLTKEAFKKIIEENYILLKPYHN